MKKKLLSILATSMPFFAVPLVSAGCNPDNPSPNPNPTPTPEKSEETKQIEKILEDVNKDFAKIEEAYKSTTGKKEKLTAAYKKALETFTTEQKTKVEEAIQKSINEINSFQKILEDTFSIVTITSWYSEVVNDLQTNEEKAKKTQETLLNMIKEIEKSLPSSPLKNDAEVIAVLAKVSEEVKKIDSNSDFTKKIEEITKEVLDKIQKKLSDGVKKSKDYFDSFVKDNSFITGNLKTAMEAFWKFNYDYADTTSSILMLKKILSIVKTLPTDIQKVTLKVWEKNFKNTLPEELDKILNFLK